LKFNYPINIGRTESGRDFEVTAMDLQSLNVIVGLKWMGKSHLAKSLLLGLIKHGGGALVFDINDEYSSLHLGKDRQPKEEYKGKLQALTPGVNLKFPLRAMGTDVFLNFMEAVGVRDASLATLSEKVQEIGEEELTLPLLRTTISSVDRSVRGALARRLKMLEDTKLVDDEAEASALEDLLKKLNQGNALVINLKGKTRIAMRATVQVILSKVTRLLDERVLDPMFLFAEEAHMYAERTDLEDLVTRMRHLGAWQFYMTNTPTSLPELVVRQTDNLFSFHLSLPDDIKYVAPASGMDDQTLGKIVKALPPREYLAAGKVTEDYPFILRTSELDVITAGETRLRFTKP